VAGKSFLFPAIEDSQESAQQKIRDLYNKAIGRDELTRMLYIDVKLYMADDVLVKADRMSMANSIELRSPLLDQDIVAFAFSLPSQMKIRGMSGKYLLKKLAAKYVDPQILNLPKTGFSIPLDHYMRTSWRSDIEDRLLQNDNSISEFVDTARLRSAWQQFLKGSNISLQLLWAIYILSLWFSEFHQQQTFLPHDAHPSDN
jgi:asparagine synthase (glutamine-hydrolysing)